MRLRLIGISKYFPGVKALEDIHFELQPGEIHAVCGENGAGKSTLMNILTGNLQPDAGQIILNEEKVQILDPAHAAQVGIAIVYQQLSLVDTLSVAENIFANQQPRNKWGIIQYKALFTRTKQLLHKLNIDYIHPRTLVATLSPGQKQMVEIAKALSKQPDILILDEPTASITERETQSLFNIIRQLKTEKKSVIYISHRMREIFEIADRVTVLKDGRYQGTHTVADIQTNDLIRLMVGREIEISTAKSSATNEVLLQVTSLSGQGFQDISFTLHKGEIVGMAGLVGAGRTEVAQTIFGYLPRQAGVVRLNGKEIKCTHPADTIAAGIGYVPEEQKSQGLFLDRSVTDNMIVANSKAAQTGNWFEASIAAGLARSFKEKLRIAAPDVEQKVVHLSGGNQQKVVLAKWLLANPDVLIVDEPTHGIDVGAKAEIYDLLRVLASQGKGILLISSELPEILSLADRILVIRQGRISGEVIGKETTEEEILELAAI